MVLEVCHALGKFEHEVFELTPDELARHIALLKLKAKEEQRRARKRNG